jgi:hypothetical protein
MRKHLELIDEGHDTAGKKNYNLLQAVGSVCNQKNNVTLQTWTGNALRRTVFT